MAAPDPDKGNIWHPVNQVPTVQRRVLRLISGLADLAVQISIGRDYYIKDRLDRLDREWEAIKEKILQT